MPPYHYQAIIFDFDDTLVQSGPIKWAQHKAVAQEFYGIELTDAKLSEHWGKPFDDMIGHLYEQADTVERMRAANYSIEHRFPKTTHPEAIAAINRLQSAGKVMGILSAMNRDMVTKDLLRLGFPVELFLFIQCAEATTIHKPDPKVFEPALAKLEALGISPAATLYVGDALSDFYAASGAGVAFLGVTTGFVTQAEFSSAGAKSIANLSQLLSY